MFRRVSTLITIVVAAEWPDPAFSLLSRWPAGTEPCKNPRLLGRRRYVADDNDDDDDDDDDDDGDYVFLCDGSVRVCRFATPATQAKYYIYLYVAPVFVKRLWRALSMPRDK